MMHSASASQHQPSPATPRSASAAPFCHAIYGSVAGWIELRAGVARTSDPTKIDLVPIDQAGGWFAYNPAELPRLCADIAQLTTQYGNVYVSAHVYRRPRRDAEVKPGRVIVVDDAPLGTTCSVFVQTSPASGHAYYLLDQDAPAALLHDLSRRAAVALGGDASGADLQQLVRVPGTVNTKAQHGGNYRVTSTGDTGQRSTRAELESRWPDVAPRPTLDPATVAAWNGNRADLLTPDGTPRRWKNPAVPGWRVLRGDLVPSSTSEARYIIISSLVTHRYPDAEILVLARQLADFDAATRKGSAWLDADILRCSAKARARYGISAADTQPSRAQSMQPAQPLPIVAYAKKGRKVTLTPAALRTYYQTARDAGNRVMQTVGMVAEHLQVSRSSVERCERILRAEGVIERRMFNQRQASYVALLRPVTIDSASHSSASAHPFHVPSAHAPTPQPNAENGAAFVHEGTHPPAGAVPAAPAGAVPSSTPGEPAGGCVPPTSGTLAFAAMWHAADADLPVTVTGVLGTANGVVYVSIAESSTGIPLHEIELLDPAAGATLTPPARVATPPPAPAAPPASVSLTVLIRECFDAYAGVPITRKRVRSYLAMNAPGATWSDVAIDATLASERKRRQQLAGRSYWDSLNAEIAGLPDLAQSQLAELHKRVSRSVGAAVKLDAERQAGTAQPGKQMPKGLQRARMLMPHIVRELDRRVAVEQAAIAQHGYCDAEQQAMLDHARAAIQAMQPTTRASMPRATVKPTERAQPTQAGWAMIARLKARAGSVASA